MNASARETSRLAAAVIAVGCLGAAVPLAQAQDLAWAESAGGSGNDIGRRIAADGNGNTYLAGSFADTVTFGAGASATTLTSRGGADAFIAKFTPGGGLVWARSAGGPGLDGGTGIAVDGAGNSYVTGTFAGTATFDGTNLTSIGGQDVFLAKYDSNGNLVWARSAGGAGADLARGIATGANGRSYVTGHFSGIARFGAGAARVTLRSRGNNDMFVAGYSPDGGLLWANRAGGASADSGASVATDQEGSALVTGTYARAARFAPGATSVLRAVGSIDVFIVKYDENGRFLWVKSAGGAGSDSAMDIATDRTGNSYVTGSFARTATFGVGREQAVLTSRGSSDAFVAKYSRQGRLFWATAAGGISVDRGRGIATDDFGNSVVTGTFVRSATFGADADEVVLDSAGSHDVFLAAFDQDGNLDGATSAGGPGADRAEEIATDNNGNCYVTGAFPGTASFGDDDVVLTSNGRNDAFVARYRRCRSVILVWYGSEQRFGPRGEAQRWINILGNVADRSVTALSYSLNGGADRPLSIGPDTRRLHEPGDFNVDIDFAELDPSARDDVVTIKARFGSRVVTRDVVIDYRGGRVWPKNYAFRWDRVKRLQNAVQVIDGQWSLGTAGVRTDRLGYDRVLVIGDDRWDSYEITTSFRIHEVSRDPRGRDGNGIAFGMLWGGHTDNPIGGVQPKAGWIPGAAFFFRSGVWRLHASNWFNIITVSDRVNLQLETTYNVKIRNERTNGFDRTYSMKMWEQGDPEPNDWLVQGTEQFDELRRGSFFLNAHYFNLTFGDIDVVALN